MSTQDSNWKESDEWTEYWKLISVDIDREIADSLESFIEQLIQSERERYAQELTDIINRCQTQKGLGISLVRYVKKLSALNSK